MFQYCLSPGVEGVRQPGNRQDKIGHFYLSVNTLDGCLGHSAVHCFPRSLGLRDHLCPLQGGVGGCVECVVRFDVLGLCYHSVVTVEDDDLNPGSKNMERKRTTNSLCSRQVHNRPRIPRLI
ncbi:hypothetical protein PoB_005626600 [Plakobranchus ocellatus]|uniref:Uncharacterized protein n=1 Tax=Plakobranchus ocellatus TaxID=259542 RepID=A0AAV4CEI0_9GAST|nr:hypothetical protein PoB_005626600 [Plakobranchus ocellatus]